MRSLCSAISDMPSDLRRDVGRRWLMTATCGLLADYLRTNPLVSNGSDQSLGRESWSRGVRVAGSRTTPDALATGTARVGPSSRAVPVACPNPRAAESDRAYRVVVRAYAVVDSPGTCAPLGRGCAGQAASALPCSIGDGDPRTLLRPVPYDVPSTTSRPRRAHDCDGSIGRQCLAQS